MGAERINDFIHQNFRSGGTSGDPDRVEVLKLRPIQIRGALYQQGPRAAIVLAHFHQAF